MGMVPSPPYLNSSTLGNQYEKLYDRARAEEVGRSTDYALRNTQGQMVARVVASRRRAVNRFPQIVGQLEKMKTSEVRREETADREEIKEFTAK
jgi:hypothetical protein